MAFDTIVYSRENIIELHIFSMSESPFKESPSFLKRMAGFAAGIAVALPAVHEAEKAFHRQEVVSEQESVEHEKKEILTNIQQGREAEVAYHKAMDQYNSLVDMSNALDKKSDAFKKVDKEMNYFARQMSASEVARGDTRLGLLKEANEYTKAFEADTVAVRNFALARTLFERGMQELGSSQTDLGYWHNCAAGYKELGNKSESQIREKFRQFFEYAKANRKLTRSSIPHEQMLFFLLEDSFDFSLTAESLQAELEKQNPEWKQDKATHVNKDSYRSFNNLDTFDIFELNRLHAVLMQMNNEEFQASLFETRDQDLHKSDTEVGGLVPRPEQDHKLYPIDAKRTGNNKSYVNPTEGAVLQFSTLTEFHFHATEMEEHEEYHGPSGGDFSFFSPGVVFSSVDNDTIRAHFYVSRDMAKGGPKNDVVSLGTIAR